MCRNRNKDDCYIKTAKHIASSVAGSLLLLTAVLAIVINLPSTQRRLGEWVADAISEKLGTDSSVGRIDFALPNRLIIHDLLIADQKGDSMLYARMAAVNICPGSKAGIGAVQIIDSRAWIKSNDCDEWNFQFAVDSLSSSDSDSETQIAIDDIIIRNLQVCHTSTPGSTFSRYNGNATLNLSAKSIDIDASDISCKYTNLFGSINFADTAFASPCTLSLESNDINFRDNEFKTGDTHLDISSNELDLTSLRLAPQSKEAEADIASITLCPTLPTMLRAVCTDLPQEFSTLSQSMLPAHMSGTITIDSTHVSASDIDAECADNNNNIHIARLETTHDFSEFCIHDAAIDLSANAASTLLPLTGLDEEASQMISRLGDISIQGSATKDTSLAIEAAFKSTLGNAMLTYSPSAATAEMKSFSIGKLLAREDIGKISGNIQLHPGNSAKGRDSIYIKGVASSLEYGGYAYRAIKFDAVTNHFSNLSDVATFKATISVDDPNLTASISGSGTRSEAGRIGAKTTLQISANRMALMPMLKENAPQYIDLTADAEGEFSDLYDATGSVDITHLTIDRQQVGNCKLNISSTDGSGRRLHFDSDFLTADLEGYVNGHSADFDFDATVCESEMLQQFVRNEVNLSQPVHIAGHYNTLTSRLKADIYAPCLNRKGETYHDTHIRGIAQMLNAEGRKSVVCNNVYVVSGDYHLLVNGTVSDNPSDSITATFSGFDVATLVDMVNFHAVRFGGNLSGEAVVKNIFDTPDLSGRLIVKDFTLDEGPLGTAHIQANWDNTIRGVQLQAHIEENDSSFTDVTGHVAPSSGHDDILINIAAHNTNADFLNGMVGGIFDNIHGDVNGLLTVVTDSTNAVDLLGTMNADVALTLHPTAVEYHVDARDTIRFQHDRFAFEDLRLHDRHNQTAVVNGTVSHHNVKNFSYSFDIDYNDFLLYDEHEFNSDKFLATVFGNGSLSLRGADGHALKVNADVTPSRGSVFTYDASTPDAISTNSFITFHQKDTTATDPLLVSESAEGAATIQPAPAADYSSDIFLDMNIHVTPDCAIKLKMDSADDGYITTYGTGNLLAHYHNKSPFTLHGTYNITGGKYRLYLQDIIYRDMELQKGSSAVFNGNPFDANIHLICWHTLNAVPLRDLSATAAFSQNNKVKVICQLDVTGTLGNMNVGFDMQLPNVSDETRQMVRSLISTQEEMDMQMIYLLGLGRFYTSEMARASGETGTGQAANSLLSSTISGQVNQILDNVIGTNRSWNFGTGLSTGEKGWEDLDVEGTLSGRLFDDRLLINGNFGYRENSLTNKTSFIGDFDVKYKLWENRNIYIKAYNQTNDRYFTKATLNTQGLGISVQKDFDSWKQLFRRKKSLDK